MKVINFNLKRKNFKEKDLFFIKQKNVFLYIFLYILYI